MLVLTSEKENLPIVLYFRTWRGNICKRSEGGNTLIRGALGSLLSPAGNIETVGVLYSSPELAYGKDFVWSNSASKWNFPYLGGFVCSQLRSRGRCWGTNTTRRTPRSPTPCFLTGCTTAQRSSETSSPALLLQETRQWPSVRHQLSGPSRCEIINSVVVLVL